MSAIEVQGQIEAVIAKASNSEVDIDQPKQKQAKEGDSAPPVKAQAEPKELVFSDPFDMHDERNQEGMPNLPANDRTPQVRPRPVATV